MNPSIIALALSLWCSAIASTAGNGPNWQPPASLHDCAAPEL